MRTDAIVLHLTRYKRSGREVEWSRYATYVGYVPFGEFESDTHRCAVHLIITTMFAAEWRNHAYTDLFYSRVLEKDYAAALAIPRPLEETFVLLCLPGAGVLVTTHASPIPTVEDVDRVAQAGFAEFVFQRGRRTDREP